MPKLIDTKEYYDLEPPDDGLIVGIYLISRDEETKGEYKGQFKVTVGVWSPELLEDRIRESTEFREIVKKTFEKWMDGVCRVQ